MKEKNKRILVLGSTGMLGSMVTQYLVSQRDKGIRRYQVYSTYSSNKLNLNKPNLHQTQFSLNSLNDIYDLRQIINAVKPRFIINCIGLIKQKVVTQNNQFKYLLINTYLPAMLSNFVQLHNTDKTNFAEIIQIQTDCAFDGSTGYYKQLDDFSANDLYGLSKIGGECVGNRFIKNIRTSIIGLEIKDHKGLFDYIYFNNNTNINGFTNHLWNGCTTLQFAQLCDKIMNENFCCLHTRFNYVIHSPIRKGNLLLLINKIFNLNKAVNLVQAETSINRVIVPSFDCGTKTYQQSLIQLKQYLQNSQLYKQIYKK